MGDCEELGTLFVNQYYNIFDNDRPSVITFYQPTSLLTFEGQKFQGVEEISNKFNSLPFNQCRHSISTIDIQPSPINGGIAVFVSGTLQLPGEERLLRYSQMFNLIPATQGSYFVQNDIFRLNYC